MERTMKIGWLVIALAGLGLIAADPALARAKKKVHVAPQCVDRPEQFSLGGLFFNPKPQPNGCAPPVYQYGQYIGQDPDANIRAYMKKDVWTGYAPP
ncbi:MAG TPA: hypothetical protein VHT93_19515 [Pseudolabrys sp.]|jgi:hypothetical protein|nr:hypothetical protein [Pseudolabrys sp.]